MTKRILAVEDDALIALTLAQDLEDAGYIVVGPCASVDAALKALAADDVDGAVLDLSLGNETSEPIASALRTMGAPFIVASGYDEDRLFGALKGAKTIGKPYCSQELIMLLPQLS